MRLPYQNKHHLPAYLKACTWYSLCLGPIKASRAMVHYKLCYFNVRGKAEGIRYIFAQAGVDFEDHRVSHDEWPKLKPSTPMGQLPVLHVDNKVLCQSMAIARYIAKEYGLVPSNHFLAAKADMIVDGLGDQYPNIRPYMMALMKGDADEAAKLWDAYKKEHLPGFLDMYEKFLTEAGGKYFAGDHLSWADLLVAEQLDRLILFNKSDSLLANHKHLAQLVKHVHELPNIKKYLASRPQTTM